MPKFANAFEKELYYVSQIDFSYWMLKKISNHSSKIENPLNAMIGRATGFDKIKVLQQIKACKYYAGVIIRCKEKLNYETENDKKFLTAIKKLERENPAYETTPKPPVKKKVKPKPQGKLF